MTLWLALMAVSGGTLIVIAARKKEKPHKANNN
ncbi:MAG: hypothetical protein ACLR23_23975 [Clostridia bacterium]